MKKNILLTFLLFSFVFLTAQNDIKKTEIGKNNVTKIILLRHAEKVLDGTKDPKLTSEGEKRAERLGFMFLDIKIDKIFSSPYTRTKMTVAKLAENKNLEIEEYDPKDLAFAKYLQEKEQGKTSVIVGHSNSIPKLVNQLIGEEKFNQLNEEVYSKIWILTFSNDTLIDCSLFNF
ncbi:histidine phosphatase family protein [Flavobacterium jejuense]|uniref:Histidine phosphatase family protein n=1 Tax=Flavobacterium jejuense TaxID=1544455 RepID=A0ABX0ITN4_9FLAO|nr:phosphoglycerate mutase family protein [Flavobacterium jejuense]NHN27068.1 histidine phosphatase family protein [Flavobacterium jejuense]